MYGFDMSGWSGHMMGFGWLWLILIVVILLVFINSNNAQKKDKEPSARDILDKRYANGEIDDEEYKRRRDNLR